MLSAAIRKKVRREPPKAQRSRDRPADRIGFAFRSGRQSNPECLLAFGRFPIIDKSLLSVLPPCFDPLRWKSLYVFNPRKVSTSNPASLTCFQPESLDSHSADLPLRDTSATHYQTCYGLFNQ